MEVGTINLPSPLSLSIELTDEQFFQLCHQNHNYRFERTASGELLIMPLTGSETGRRNANLSFQLYAWSRQNNLGVAFDSSTGFKLPNGAVRSPDASWVRRDRWDGLTASEQERFAPLCPDFVVELLCPSDSLKETQGKMKEYIKNGASLGWLLDRKNQRVEIYRQGQDVEMLSNPETLSGENILPGFVLDLTDIL